MDLAKQVQFDNVVAEYTAPIQIAGLRVSIIDTCVRDASTPDELRRSLTRQLQRTLPRSVPGSVRADASTMPNSEFAKTEQRVKAAVIEQAHLSETLRPVVTRDRTGRECTEFYGKKSGWMQQFSDPPRLMKSIDGAPVKLPMVL